MRLIEGFERAFAALGIGAPGIGARRRLAPLGVLAFALLCSACTHTRASFLDGAVMTAPLSFVRTCADAPQQCAATAPKPAAPLGDRASLKVLQHVNAAVNSRIPVDPRLQVNARDEWLPPQVTVDGPAGDCKSFAAEKRRQLIANGFPAERLSYAVVFHPTLGLHALLLARLDKGDYVLDSRQPWVVPWQDAGYVFVAYQQPGRPEEWRNAQRRARPRPVVEVQILEIAVSAPTLAPGPTGAREMVGAPDMVSALSPARAADVVELASLEHARPPDLP